MVTVTIFATAKVFDNQNKYQSVLAMAEMFEDTNFIAYISDVATAEKEPAGKQYVEVFDIKKGQVILSQVSNLEIQNEVFNYIKTIRSLYTKVMPFPDKGYVIRIPFEKAVSVDHQLLNESGIKAVDSVFIIVSDKEAPIMLILDGQRKPCFYTFNASIQPLLDYVELNPEETNHQLSNSY